jgi:hypothetical protein
MLMYAVPTDLLAGLSPTAGEQVIAWWASLAPEVRSQVTALCDPRQDAFFGLVPDEAATGVPVVIGGRFVPRDGTAGWAEWHAELFDHLLSNPELVIFAPPAVRTFHICTRHEAARAVLAAGRIPADFQCPLGINDCPMRRLWRADANHPLQQRGAALRLFPIYCYLGGRGC